MKTKTTVDVEKIYAHLRTMGFEPQSNYIHYSNDCLFIAVSAKLKKKQVHLMVACSNDLTSFSIYKSI